MEGNDCRTMRRWEGKTGERMKGDINKKSYRKGRNKYLCPIKFSSNICNHHEQNKIFFSQIAGHIFMHGNVKR
jgi:hypothetical protein